MDLHIKDRLLIPSIFPERGNFGEAWRVEERDIHVAPYDNGEQRRGSERHREIHMVQTTAQHGGCGGEQRRIVRHHGLRRGTHRLRFLKRPRLRSIQDGGLPS